ncbi:MAG: peptidase M23 [Verrucomicrobia bacterium RIFCSPLOWO2_12_FULL_64_8]|nr:MAG: peptidase M23 [Verrucomicrobia bacterium RIFCSPLOWO2_12_FULL_64_8]
MLTATAAAGPRLEITWPTPNTAWLEGRPAAEYLQPTVSGEVASGGFGCVRNDGFQFHEGVDLKPVARDARGEPRDKVFAVLPGVVRYINTSAGDSSYGRYIVIEHTGVEPSVLTLYAHLRSPAPGLRVGAGVERGQVIAIMGHSAGGYAIPRERAHLHFEIGVWVTRDFQAWYDRKRFGSPNEHGIWNGMNIIGLDPLDFYNHFRTRAVNDFQEYFNQLAAAARVRVVTRRTPDFIRRYPALLRQSMPAGAIGGWEIDFTWFGLPFAWRPLTAMDTAGRKDGEVSVVTADRTAIARYRAKVLVRPRGAGYAVGKDLDMVLEQLFGLK